MYCIFLDCTDHDCLKCTIIGYGKCDGKEHCKPGFGLVTTDGHADEDKCLGEYAICFGEV